MAANDQSHYVADENVLQQNYSLILGPKRVFLRTSINIYNVEKHLEPFLRISLKFR